MYRLLNSYTVLEMSQNLIKKKYPKNTDKDLFDRMVRNLVISEDFSLMSSLAKHAKNALSNYTDSELAALVANKRLTDFKQALALRNVLSMDSPGTYSWIMYQSEKNRLTLGSIPNFDELFAQVSVADFIERIPMENNFEIAAHTH